MLLDFINQGGSLREIYQCKCNSPGYIYIPAKDEQHKSWGELSGYRKELAKRNAIIIMEYKNGVSVAELADRYFLSVSAIRKIIYQK